MKRAILTTVTYCIIALATPSNLATAGNVLLLNDGNASKEVRDYLRSDGHTVATLEYQTWNGTNPTPDSYDLVLLLNGYNYGLELGGDANSPAYAKLESYVRSGGVFMLTEWTAFNMATIRGKATGKMALEPLVPFDIATYDGYGYGGVFTMTASSPLLGGVSSSFAGTENDGGSCLDLKAETRVLLTRTFVGGDDCVGSSPALVTLDVGAGMVIWLNSDLGHEYEDVANANQLKIMSNAARYIDPGVLWFLLRGQQADEQ